MRSHGNKTENKKPQGQLPTPDTPLPRSVLVRGNAHVQRYPSGYATPGVGPAIPKEDRKEFGEEWKAARWNVRGEDVDPLPPFFPLERTHVVVEDTPSHVISGRIAESLREESIWAQFNERKASALAETSDHVRFYVRLFKPSHSTADRIIVEVQRRSGCTIRFHNACRIVLGAARGVGTRRGKEVRDLPVDLAPKEKLTKEVNDALEITRGLMKKDRLDANMLGMESLRMLSDAKCSGQERALCAARKILLEDDGVSKMVVSLVRCWKLREDDDLEASPETRHFGILHNHALAVLANVLTLLSGAGELGTVLDGYACRWVQDDEMLLALVQELENAEHRAHDSFEAARCLNVLSQSSERIKSRSLELGVQVAAQRCFDEGKCKHAMLAKESGDMVRTLGCGV